VSVGGVAAKLTFSGQAPGYLGVSQINTNIPQNPLTGNSVPLIVKSADGTGHPVPLPSLCNKRRGGIGVWNMTARVIDAFKLALCARRGWRVPCSRTFDVGHLSKLRRQSRDPTGSL
jgi:hypothetical protein